MAAKVETLHAQHGTTTDQPTPKAEKAKRGEGVTITIDFKDHIELLEKIREQAKRDDREPSKWLRRFLVLLDNDGNFFPPEDEDDDPAGSEIDR